jgi:signal transduction histidine kinase/ActR/RegA family two-component response regulator
VQRKSVRWHLFDVLLVTLIPIGLFAAALLYLHWQTQERERERAQMESVRLLAAAVDNALDSTEQRLSIFARLWASSRASDEVIYTQARETLAASPDWSNVVAFRANGSGVFRADEAFGASVPKMKLVGLWQPVLGGKRAHVSDVFVAPSSGERVASVGVPVMREGKVTHILIAALDLDWFDQLLARQGLPPHAVSALIDRNGKFIARSYEGQARRGEEPTAQFIADAQARPEGIGRYTNLNGTGVITAWTTTRHGWTVGFGTPAAPVDNAFRRHLFTFGLLWALAVAGGVGFAVRKGRRIARSLTALEAQAGELAAGRRVGGLPDSGVEEVARTFDALEKASEVLQATTRERDRSLAVEREARTAAEALNRAKDEFLAMLGHELRNPLAAILNAALLVKNQRRTPEQLEFAAGVIERQSQHLKRLIDDLLDVGRVMTGKIRLERSALDLGALARRVAATLQTSGRLADRHLQVDAAPAWVDGDATRLEQVASNLIVNAATYTEPGGHIRVRVAREGAETVLEVSDDGRGIRPDALPRLFDLFFQADSTVDRSTGGLGIGLTLVKRLVELHGGSVRAASEGRGKGATFTVRLPETVAQSGAPSERAGLRAPLAGTVLLVEDNSDARESLRMLLELEGHRVIAAPDGLLGLELLKRHRPPVAIVDIGLPGLDGYRFAMAARGELGHGVLLVALTGYGARSDERRAKDAGFDVHLAKPVGLGELAEALGRAAARADCARSAVAQ